MAEAAFPIERAQSSDHADLYALELRCFDPGMAFHARQIKDLLNNPRADVWVMREGTSIIAQLIVLRKKFRDGVHARIYSLTVDRAQRGKGLSRRLLNHVQEDLQCKGIRKVYLEVESDALVPIQLYHSMGFTDHRLLNDYYEVGRHGIKMRKVLEARIKPPVQDS